MPIVNYLWDEVEDNVIEEYDDAGNTIAEYDTEPSLYGNINSQYRGDTTSYFHHDGISNTVTLTDDNCDVTDTRAYSAFGEVTVSTGTTEFPFQFGGKKGYYWDDEYAAIYARRREYCISIERWLSRDPLTSPEGGDINSYRYVHNNTPNQLDPSGEAEDEKIEVEDGKIKITPGLPSITVCDRNYEAWLNSKIWGYLERKITTEDRPCVRFSVDTGDCDVAFQDEGRLGVGSLQNSFEVGISITFAGATITHVRRIDFNFIINEGVKKEELCPKDCGMCICDIRGERKETPMRRVKQRVNIRANHEVTFGKSAVIGAQYSKFVNYLLNTFFIFSGCGCKCPGTTGLVSDRPGPAALEAKCQPHYSKTGSALLNRLPAVLESEKEKK